MESNVPSPGAALSFSDLLQGAGRAYRQSLARTWPTALLAALVNAALDVYIARKAGYAAADPIELYRLYQLPDVQALSLVEGVLWLALFGGLIVQLYDACRGDPVRGARAACAAGFARIGHAALIFVLWLAIVSAGLLLAIIPGIYWSGTLCLWPVPLFAENAQGIAPLTRSRECVRGRWWTVSSVQTLAWLALLFGSAVAGWFGDGLAAALQLHGIGTLTVEEVLGMAATTLLLPYGAAILAAAYVPLSARPAGKTR